jgi:hypothetical protein
VKRSGKFLALRFDIDGKPSAISCYSAYRAREASALAYASPVPTTDRHKKMLSVRGTVGVRRINPNQPQTSRVNDASLAMIPTPPEPQLKGCAVPISGSVLWQRRSCERRLPSGRGLPSASHGIEHLRAQRLDVRSLLAIVCGIRIAGV